MTDPIIVPISAPGGTEAAVTARRFATTLGEAALATDQLAASQAKAIPAVRAEEQATNQSTQVHQHHIRTIEQETARLRVHEEQLRITAAARRALGESFNAQDIGAMRRLARSTGGIGGEIGRGVTEGVEGFQGGGLRSGLGFAGAGLAAGFVGLEGLRAIVDRIKEEFEYELHTRIEITQRMREVSNSIGDLGASAQGKHESAIRTLTGMGGGLLKSAQDMEAAGDVGAIEGVADLATRFGPGARAQNLIPFAQRAAALSGKSFGEVAKGLNQGHIAEISARGMDQALADYLRVPGQSLSVGDVQAREANLAASPIIATLNKNNALAGQKDVSDIGHIGAQQGGLRQGLAASLAPEAAGLTAIDIASRDDMAKQQADQASWAALGMENHPILNAMLLGAPQYLAGAARQYKNWWGTGPDKQAQQAADRSLDIGNTMMPGASEAAGHLRAAADALERGGSDRRPGQATGAMQ